MDESECRTRADTSRVARLATTRSDGLVDLVPIVFAMVDDSVVFAVDHKPKRTRNLARLANIEGNPDVTLLFDHYADEDWDELWWVRMRGRAVIMPAGSSTAGALDQLQARYHQHATQRPDGPVVWITPTEWTGWSASP